MPFDPATLGMQAATAGIGTIFGLAMEGHNDRRQREQQEHLQSLQIKGQKEMSDYNYAKQLQMWKDTNYSSQVEQLKKAGLNPGLLYGMSGGGGVTTGSPSGSVGGATAQQVPGEVGMGIQSMMQLQLLKAQKENIEADTENKKADIPVKGATENSLLQGINESSARTSLLEVQAGIEKLKKNILESTTDEQIAIYSEQLRKLEGEASQALTKANLDTDARSKRLEQIKVDVATSYLQQKLIQAQTGLTTQKTAESVQDVRFTEQKIRATIEGLAQGWMEMDLQSREQAIKKMLADYNVEITNDMIKGLTHSLGRLLGGGK